MTPQAFDSSLALLKRSGVEQVRLLGGEPTRHPDFQRLVSRSLEQGFRVLIFSNGLMNDQTLSFIERLSNDRVALLLNLVTISDQGDSVRQRQLAVLSRLGKKVTVGVTIHTRAPNIDFLLDLVEMHRLNRAVRLGISHPAPGCDNDYLSDPLAQR